jgi:hypothetical protein
MSKVYLQRSILPCIDSPVIRWHVEHGWVYDIMAGHHRPIGVIYCSVICGHGCVAHFDTLAHSADFATIRQAFRAGVDLLRRDLPLVLTTVPEEKRSLIRLLQRFGFRKISRAGEYAVLQLF